MTDGKRTSIGNKTCRLAIKVKAGTTGCNITCPELDEVLADATATYKTGVTAADKKGIFEGEQSNPDKEYDDDGNMYQTWYVQISEKNASSQSFNFTLTNQLNSENDYISHFQVNEIDIKHNPLWWMAQYNVETIAGVLGASATTFSNAHSLYKQGSTSVYANVFSITDAGKTAVGGSAKMQNYHQPTLEESMSIVPGNIATASTVNIWSVTNSYTATNPYEFSELACVIGGNPVSASTSYFYKAGDCETYAIRFVGTDYASAWHYKQVTSPCKGLLIESFLIDAATPDQAKEALKTIASSTTWETDGYNALSTKANLSPGNTDSSNDGYAQRFIPCCGYRTSGSGTANSGVGTKMHYWMAGASYNSSLFHWCIENNDLHYHLNSTGYGFSVRLFLDY